MKRSAGFGTILALTVAGGVLSACSTSGPTQAQVASPIMAMNSPGMQHGGMDHSMMDLGPADANFDLRFIDAMIPHHEGAVVMAQAALKNSKRPEILKLAKGIIKAQEQEIAQMQQWRKQWYPKMGNTPMAWHASMGHMMSMTPEQIKAMRMDMDLGAADANFDRRFIDAMIPHHQGALTMANAAQTNAQRPELKKLAQAILTSQQAEIQQMEQWRKAWYP